MRKFSFFPLAVAIALAALAAPAPGGFTITTTISNPSAFTPAGLEILQTALADAETLWETHITGYQPGISLMEIPVTVVGRATSGLASAVVAGSVVQGGYRLSTAGRINVNTDILEPFSDYEGTGVNIIDELMAHEIGHVLGIGTQWVSNGHYAFGSGRYTGTFGLEAYRAEFDPLAEFVPVELAGGPGTADAHWDQLMRSSPQEGNPSDPFSLDPRVGIVDRFGRDLGLELMTGAMDPDFGEPFLSRTTVQSMRDLGFTVVPEPGAAALSLLAAMMWPALRRRLG